MAFGQKLDATKREIGPDFPWYPYGSLGNFIHLEPILAQHPLDQLIAGGPVLDVGAADGELALFIESLGHAVDIVDHTPTNFNALRGARLLVEHQKSSIAIHDVDLDSHFALPPGPFNLVFFLGILYHLKNPFYVLGHFAMFARHMLLSTRVARFAPDGRPIRDISVAYLLGPQESNNDATNFWIFSEAGLRQLFNRTGWDVVGYLTVGDTVASNPASNDHDERAFVLLRSRRT